MNKCLYFYKNIFNLLFTQIVKKKNNFLKIVLILKMTKFSSSIHGVVVNFTKYIMHYVNVIELNICVDTLYNQFVLNMKY